MARTCITRVISWRHLIYLPSHKAPVQSPLQEQTVLLLETLHVPSFLQGLPSQGLTVIKSNNIHVIELYIH